MRTVILIEAILLLGGGALLLRWRKSVPNTLLGAIVGLFAYYLFIKWLFWAELIRAVPFLIDTDVVAVATIPLLLYYYVVNLPAPTERWKKRFAILLFVPVVVGFCWYGVYQLFWRPPVDAYFQPFPLRYPFWEIDTAFFMILDLYVFACFFFILITIYRCLRNCPPDRRQHVRTIFLFFVSLTLCMASLMIVMQFDSLAPAITVHALFGGHGIFLVVFSIKYPEYTQELQQISRLLKKNPLHNNQSEVKRILKELDTLIRHEKVYCDPEISLPALSNQLNTTVHNLSFILNEKIGMNFRSFINHHRIREVERLLDQEADKSILEIAFQVGFNSKSTFNAMFRRQTGLSPSEYKKNLEKPVRAGHPTES